MKIKKEEILSLEDKILIEFLSKYRIMSMKDAKSIYKTDWYYRKRISKLVEREYIKKYKYYYIMLDKRGRKESNLIGKEYIKNKSNISYMDRLIVISNIAMITIDSDINFIPSWKIKNKEVYTETARKFLGEINTRKSTYIVYYIDSNKSITYFKQIIFDINKTINYDNLIIFVDDYKIISQMKNYFIFDKKHSYIIKNTNENKEILKKYNDIDFYDLIKRIYNKPILISDWEYADYIAELNHFIIVMPFIDTTKISQINWFYKENTSTKRKIDFITLKENKDVLREILTDKCNVIIFPDNLLGGIQDEEILLKE